MRRFPHTLFVKIVQDDNANVSYFEAYDDFSGMIETGEKIKLAKYELKETFMAEGIVKVITK